MSSVAEQEHPLIDRLYDLYPSLAEVLDQGKLATMRDHIEDLVEEHGIDPSDLHAIVAKCQPPANDNGDEHGNPTDALIQASIEMLAQKLGSREAAMDFLALDAIEDMASDFTRSIADEYLGTGKMNEVYEAQDTFRADLINELKEVGGIGEKQATETVRRFEKGVREVAEKEFGLTCQKR